MSIILSNNVTAQRGYRGRLVLKEKALIVDVVDGIAWVETQRKSSCGSCQAKKSCGTSVLQKVLGNKRNLLKVSNPDNFSVGDEVVLGLQEDALVKGSLLLYALPLLTMFIFAFVGIFLFRFLGAEFTEGYSILFSLTGLGVGFWYVALSSRKLANDINYQARILAQGFPEKIESIVTIRSRHEEV
ncbi:MAG: SoxR reducing system RseC family protein [Gammaproteobacteria bacterium]|nr:SoxR reducing system RseC family protein [Gammaproteobacteria bacterium]